MLCWSLARHDLEKNTYYRLQHVVIVQPRPSNTTTITWWLRIVHSLSQFTQLRLAYIINSFPVINESEHYLS